MPVSRMPGDIAREEDSDLYIVRFQIAQDAFPVMVEQGEGQPVVVIMPIRKDVSCLGFRQVFTVTVDVRLPNLLELRQLLQLCEAKSCTHLAGFHVPTNTAIQKFEVVLNAIHAVTKSLRDVLRVVADATPVAVHECFLLQLGVIEHDDATHASGGDDVRGIERDHRDVRLFCVSDRVAGILKQPDSLRYACSQLFPINLAPRQVRQKDALGLRGDRC
mmetsp:Transcript_104391/g.185632  ORF Transcript_104391/g.185632 Transcript_104391/m.185632 type:complete len:218 (-) Transcript_104391:474-1127(-)